MGAHRHEAMFNLKRGTLKVLAWKCKIPYQTAAMLRVRFYLFNELELEALFAAHSKLKGKKKGFLARTCFPDIHPPRPLHMQHSHYQ